MLFLCYSCGQVGAKDQNVGYSPPFEPYWCRKWTGLSAMTYKPESSNGTEALRNGPSDAVLHMTRGTSDIWANFQVSRFSQEESQLRLSEEYSFCSSFVCQ